VAARGTDPSFARRSDVEQFHDRETYLVNSKINRQQFLHLTVGGMAALVLAPSAAGAFAETPLRVLADEGVLVLLPAKAAKAGGKRKKVVQKAKQTFTDAFQQVVGGVVRTGLPHVKDPAAVVQEVAPGIASLVKHLDAGQAVGLLGIAAAVAAPTNLKETLTVRLEVNGASYETTITEVETLALGSLKVQVNFPFPFGQSTQPFLVALFLRETKSPGTGLLLLLAADPLLRDALGVQDADFAGTELAVSYELGVTGSQSGPHQADNPGFTDLVYGKTGVAQLGVPAALASQAQAFLESL
jgi:hypothetical protein